MSKLTDTQLVILSAASRRDGGKVLPLPESLKVNKGAVATVLKSLVKRGLLAEQPAERDDEAWREAGDGQPMTLAISGAGLQAIGVEAGDEDDAETPDTPPRPARRPTRTRDRREGRASASADLSRGTRSGTKQARLIEMLRRPEGATVAEISEATGWQSHSVRGAISGALKKKLGLTVTSEVVADRGRVYRIAGQS